MVSKSAGQTILPPMHSGERFCLLDIFFWEQLTKFRFSFTFLTNFFICLYNLWTGQAWSVEQHQARQLWRLCDWNSVKWSQSYYPMPNVCNRKSTKRDRKRSLQQLSCWKISREEFRRWNNMHKLWSWAVHHQLQRTKVQSLWSRKVSRRRRKNSMSSMHSRERFFYY